jgi:Protein prenyltransferase alpha subunit repeat
VLSLTFLAVLIGVCTLIGHVLWLGMQAVKVAVATSAVFKARRAGDYGNTILGAVNAVLEANPDVYTLWNIRREAFELGAQSGSQGAAEAASQEMLLVDKCLRKQPKSYPAWHHRQWVVERTLVDLTRELAAVDECGFTSLPRCHTTCRSSLQVQVESTYTCRRCPSSLRMDYGLGFHGPSSS